MGNGHHSCSVAVCRNTSINAKKRGLIIHFFRFPLDPNVKKVWISKCGPTGKRFNPNNARICSDHFTSDDYEDSLKARIMGEKPKKLKKCAVPTLLLHPSMSKNQSRNPTKKVCRKIKEVTTQVLDESSCQTMPSSASTSAISHPPNGKIKSEKQETNLSKSSNSKNVTKNKKSHDMELEQRIFQFMATKVQILVAELL